MFRVGQKVVCVDDSDCFDRREDGVRSVITRGTVYEIRWIGICNASVCVRLIGVLRDAAEFDHPFWASRFRPLVARQTDIAIFTAMLNPAPKKIREDVG